VETLNERTEAGVDRGIGDGSLSQAGVRPHKSCEQVRTSGHRIQSSGRGTGILYHGGGSRALRLLRVRAFR
jgi:hypothetical protein